MNTVINIRTDKEVRRKAKRVFDEIGISTSAGINMFLRQVVLEKGLPFTPTCDTKKIRAQWDKDVKEALRDKGYFSGKDVLRGL